MASVNKVILIGNLGADPEMRVTGSGDVIAQLRVATTEKWKDRTSGELRDATEWHRVVLYRRLAEIARDYLTKGSPLYLEGTLRTRKWQGKDGVERTTTEIEATDLRLLSSRPSGNESGKSAAPRHGATVIPTRDDDPFDVPF